MKLLRNWLPFFGGVLLVLAIAFGIRLYNLTVLPVFADEAIYIRWSQIMANEPTLRFLPLSDGKQPLFMWVLMFLVRHAHDPLFIGRLVSVLSGIGTSLGVGTLSYYYFRSRKAALVAGLIWALSPFSIFFDRMALVDSMLAMFAIWTLLFASITARTLRIDSAMVTGFFLGAASLTKSPALFVALMIPSVWILSIQSRRAREHRFRWIVEWVGLLTITYIIAFGIYNIQRLGPNFHMLSARTADYVFPISHIWENPKDPFIFHFHRAMQWIWIMGPSSIYLLMISGAIVSLAKKRREALILIAWFLVPLAVSSAYAKVFTARYILYTLPPLFVLISGAFANYAKARRVSLLFLAIFIFQSVLYNYTLLTRPEEANLPRSERSGYLEEWTAGTGIHEVAGYIQSVRESEPERHIVVGTEGYFGTLPDGLQIYLEGMRDVTVVGVGLGINAIPSTLETAFLAGDRAYLVVNSSRLVLDKEKTPEDVGLREVLKIPKALRPDGYKEYVQFGERDYLYLFEVVNIPSKYDTI